MRTPPIILDAQGQHTLEQLRQIAPEVLLVNELVLSLSTRLPQFGVHSTGIHFVTLCILMSNVKMPKAPLPINSTSNTINMPWHLCCTCGIVGSGHRVMVGSRREVINDSQSLAAGQLQNTHSQQLARSRQTPALYTLEGGFESLVCITGHWTCIKSSLKGRLFRFFALWRGRS